jgi:hypothetical protein
VAEATDSSIVQLRKDLISWIADESLGGDRDAAEWILLTSIGRVYVFVSCKMTILVLHINPMFNSSQTIPQPTHPSPISNSLTFPLSFLTCFLPTVVPNTLSRPVAPAAIVPNPSSLSPVAKQLSFHPRVQE